jgi:hypothetical protein
LHKKSNEGKSRITEAKKNCINKKVKDTKIMANGKQAMQESPWR